MKTREVEFDIEKVNENTIVETTKGKKVKILHVLKSNPEYPIVAIVKYGTDDEQCSQYNLKGEQLTEDLGVVYTNFGNLVIIEEVKEKFANLLYDSKIDEYFFSKLVDSEKEAKKLASGICYSPWKYIKTIPVEI